MIITGSTITNNIGAGGGGGGGGSNSLYGAAGDGGAGGSGTGALWNAGGTVHMDAGTYATMSTANAGGAGAGGIATRSGSVNGAVGTATSKIFTSSGTTDTNYMPDTTPPTVSSVNSSTTNGTYKVGDLISLQVNFSEAVIVTGTPQLTLETGTTDRIVNYATGSGTSALTFTYTVQAGDTSADLDYQSTNALALNGGTIKDAAGNNSILTLASPGAANSLGSNKNIVIDGIAPTVSSVNSSTANGTYKAGDFISVQVNFSETVTVTGTPQLTLETGTTDRVINYVSGSGTSALTFTYTVQAGDTSADLDYQSTAALALNGGTIKDAAGNNGTLTLASPGTVNSLGSNKNIVIDTTAPTTTVATVAFSADTGTSSTDFITNTAAQTISGTLSANIVSGEIVEVSLDNGATWTTATSSVGSNTWSLSGQMLTASNTLKVRVSDAVGNGGTALSQAYVLDTTAPTTTIATAALSADTGTSSTDFVTKTAAQTISGTLSANMVPSEFVEVSLDNGSTWTTVTTSVGANTWSLSGQTLTASDTLKVRVSDTAGNSGTAFSQAYVFDNTAPGAPSTPDMSSGTDAGTSSTDNITNNTTPIFTGVTEANNTVTLYDTDGTTVLGTATADGSGNWSITSSVLSAGSHTLTAKSTDVAGNTSSASSGLSITIDTTAPTVTSVNSSTANGTYRIGDTVSIQVNLNEAVTVTGTPQLTLETGTTDRVVNYTSGSGTSALTFTYTVQAGDTSPDLDYQSTSALTLNGGTIKDIAGNNGTLTLASPGATNSLGNNKALVIDGLAPSVTSVSAITSDGTYKIGDTIALVVNFSETVFLSTGTLQLTLETGTTDETISYVSGSGSSSLVFNYTVQAGDSSADLDYVSTTSLVANGDTIQNGSFQNAILTLPTPGTAGSLGANAALVVDGVLPTASIVVADTALAAGQTSLVTVTFSEAITGFTAADLTVADGSVSGLNSADGGITWTATFTPTTSITDTTNLITLDNTGVQDLAGNAGTGTTDSNNYAIDTLRPTATIVVADTALAIGETSLVTFTFSEAVTGFTAADLTVANGSVSGLNSSDGGITWTATFTPSASVTDATNLITLDNTGVQDAAGNAGSGTTDSNNYAIDTMRPTATIVVADTALAIGETSLVTFNFSEAVTGFTTADLTVDNGSVSGLSSSDGGITWTATLTPTTSVTDTTNLITLDNTGVQDLAGNAGIGTTNSNNYAIDTARPTATIVVADTALAVGETSLVTVTFSEAVTGVTNADFAIANGTLSAVSSSDGGITWTATLTPTASITDPTNLITLDNTGVQDLAGNAGVGTTDSNNYAIDSLRPTATIALSDSSLGIGETSLVTITFTEAVTGFNNADLTVANGALSAVSSSDGGVTWTATFTPAAGVTDATNLITLNNTGVQDIAGNTGTGTTDSNNYAVDTVRPTATIVVADTALAAGETSLVTITMSEAVANFDNNDLSVANGTLSTAVTTDGGITWTATFTPTAGVTDTTNVITFDSTGVIDGGGNAGAGVISSNNYAIDTARPTATIAVADTALATGETSLVTITFGETVTGLSNTNLTIANGTLTAVNSSDGGITWTATFTPAANVTDLTNVIVLNNTGIVDVAGNVGVGTTSSNNYVVDTIAPTVSGLVRTNTSPTNSTSVSYTLTFSEDVVGVGVNDFTLITTDHSSATVSSVTAIDAHTYTVALANVKGGGTLRLDLNNTGTGITDVVGNALTAGIVGDTYTVAAVSPDILNVGKEIIPAPVTPTIHTISPLPITSLSVLDTTSAITGASAFQVIETHALPVIYNINIDAVGYFDVALPLQINAVFSDWSVIEVRSRNGTPLPTWLHYDLITNTLQGLPPTNFNGALDIEVVTTDAQGHRAVSSMQLHFGDARHNDVHIDKSAKPQRVTEKQLTTAKPSLDAQFKRHARNAALLAQSRTENSQQALTRSIASFL